MSIIEPVQNRSAYEVDRDGDIIMTETLLQTTPISPFKEKFNFDWFSFDGGKAANKATDFSPVSPVTESRKLSVSTISPSTYFADISPSTPSDASTDPQPSLSLDTHRPTKSQLVLPKAPNKPLAWVWQCHICRSRYPLSVIRRCLNDGHYYCSGQTSTPQRNSKRRKANRSCTSEFDYVGWQEWGKWRRKCLALKAYVEDKDEGPTIHGCEGCSFPSQCRYETRPAQERLPFDKYIDEKDLRAMVQDEVEGMISPEKVAFEEVRLSRKSSASSRESTAAIKSTTPAYDKRKESNNPSKAKSDANGSKPASKRQRFYSTFSGSKSSTEQDSSRTISDLKSQGKFDPKLPSVSAYSLSPDSKTGSASVNKDNREVDELAIVESALKAALAGQKSQKVVVPSRTNAVIGSEKLKSSATNRGVNAKLNNPEFEITDENLKNKSTSAQRNTETTPSLTRSESQQRLLTDFFRQGKSKDRDKSYTEKLRKAAAEADIEAFLQAKPADDDLEPMKQPVLVSTARSDLQHFEDINLSPGSRSNFTEVLDPPKDGNRLENTDPVKKQVVRTTAEAAEKAGSAVSSLAFLNFGFGKN